MDVDTVSAWRARSLDGSGTRGAAAATKHPSKEAEVDNIRRGIDGRDLRLLRRRGFRDLFGLQTPAEFRPEFVSKIIHGPLLRLRRRNSSWQLTMTNHEANRWRGDTPGLWQASLHDILHLLDREAPPTRAKSDV